ncbi:MAG: hypothetical protein GX148_03355 [Clostridiales bacterium]|jgi:uncharacterized membrane protein|nr:hypothetical protein [Clostridiales bacterium]
MDKKRIFNIILIVLLAITVVFNVVMVFILPGKIATKVTFDGKADKYMATPLYLLLSAAIIGLSSVTGLLFADKKTKYLVITGILFVANIITGVVNLI